MTLLVDTPQARLSVRVEGHEGLPWLILSNSLATDMSLWDPQMPALLAQRRVLRYDARGHGTSPPPAGPSTMTDLVADVIGLMDHFGIGQADVMGLSLGGMTAMGLALHHPARVRRAVCACARAVFPEPGKALWDQRAALVAQGGVTAIADETLARWFTPQVAAAIVDHARRMILGTSSEGYLSCVAALKGLNYADRLPQMQVQMLYLAGEHDGAAPPAVMSAMAGATPGSHYATVSAASHIANLEQSAAFTATVTPFLLGG